MFRWIGVTLLALVVAAPTARAADVDITGKWTASFDTQIGRQNYTYDFVVKDKVLTGKAKNDVGESDITDGKVDGSKVTFVEKFTYQGNEITITYTGEIASAEEINFTRQVGSFATEQIVAKRVK